MKKRFFIVSGILSIVLVLTLFLTSFSPAAKGDSGYATMVVYENFSIVNSRIIITYPEEDSEVVDLGPFKYNETYLIDVNKTITNTLNDLKGKGYEVVSMTASGKINSNKAMRITPILLIKD